MSFARPLFLPLPRLCVQLSTRECIFRGVIPILRHIRCYHNHLYPYYPCLSQSHLKFPHCLGHSVMCIDNCFFPRRVRRKPLLCEAPLLSPWPSIGFADVASKTSIVESIFENVASKVFRLACSLSTPFRHFLWISTFCDGDQEIYVHSDVNCTSMHKGTRNV